MKQSNGNAQVNGAREDHNKKVGNLKGLGATKGAAWNSSRRHRSI
jgi:hypothetical protein